MKLLTWQFDQVVRVAAQERSVASNRGWHALKCLEWLKSAVVFAVGQQERHVVNAAYAKLWSEKKR